MRQFIKKKIIITAILSIFAFSVNGFAEISPKDLDDLGIEQETTKLAAAKRIGQYEDLSTTKSDLVKLLSQNTRYSASDDTYLFSTPKNSQELYSGLVSAEIEVAKSLILQEPVMNVRIGYSDQARENESEQMISSSQSLYVNLPPDQKQHFDDIIDRITSIGHLLRDLMHIYTTINKLDVQNLAKKGIKETVSLSPFFFRYSIEGITTGDLAVSPSCFHFRRSTNLYRELALEAPKGSEVEETAMFFLTREIANDGDLGSARWFLTSAPGNKGVRPIEESDVGYDISENAMQALQEIIRVKGSAKLIKHLAYIAKGEIFETLALNQWEIYDPFLARLNARRLLEFADSEGMELAAKVLKELPTEAQIRAETPEIDVAILRSETIAGAKLRHSEHKRLEQLRFKGEVKGLGEPRGKSPTLFRAFQSLAIGCAILFL